MPDFDVITYAIEFQWLLTWFPIRAAADIDAPRMRGGVIRIRNTDPTFDAGTRSITPIGQALAPGVEALATNNEVSAIIDIGVSGAARVVDAAIEVRVGRRLERRHITFLPDSYTPILVNVTAGTDEHVTHDTAAAFQVVATAGPRFGLSDFVTSIFGP
jgi:hypothetical protein